MFGENRNKRWKKQACLTLSCAARAEPFPLQHDGEKFVLDGCQDGETRWPDFDSPEEHQCSPHRCKRCRGPLQATDFSLCCNKCGSLE